MSSFNLHLLSLQSNFVSWERTDHRVSKEILKCKVLPSSISSCFTFQSVVGKQSKRICVILGVQLDGNSWMEERK